MIPFPGESSPVDKRFNLAGTPVAVVADVQLRAGSSTFTAGDSVKLVSNLRTWYMEDATDVTVSWVVEVLSGSGVLTLSEGLNPSSGVGEPAATALGSHAVTGPTTLVVPSVAITATDVLDYIDYGHLHVTCDSGTVEVQQVKLRVWPSVGVAGGWGETLPSWDGETPVSGRSVTRGVLADAALGAGAEVDWHAALDEAQTFADEPWTIGSPDTNTGRLNFQTLGTLSSADDPIFGVSGASLSLALYAVAVARALDVPKIDPALGLVEGVDWIVPPNEVTFDTAVHVDPDSPDVGRDWVNTVVTVSGSTTGGTVNGAPTLAVLPYTEDDAPFVSLPITSWPDTSATVLPAGETALAVPDVDQVLFAASHTWMTTNPDYPGGPNQSVDTEWYWALGSGDPFGETFDRLGVLYTYPPYRVWSPTAVPVAVAEPLRLRQRSDGLGLGSIRVRGVASRQMSVRVRGYL